MGAALTIIGQLSHRAVSRPRRLVALLAAMQCQLIVVLTRRSLLSSDALPTMHVMGLTAEFDRATSWLSSNLRFDNSMMTSFFETTIRVLGGLVSAYDLSGNTALLDKARLLGDKLLPAFNTPTGLPLAQINLATGATAPLSWTGGSSLLAELGTCQMEFFSLSQRVRETKYAFTSQKPIDVIDKSRPAIAGLYPIYISPTSGQFTNNRVAWGAMGDSFYEYLLKVPIHTHTFIHTLHRHSTFTLRYHRAPPGHAIPHGRGAAAGQRQLSRSERHSAR